jgi:predicted amino acid-binding ACT domain protein
LLITGAISHIVGLASVGIVRKLGRKINDAAGVLEVDQTVDQDVLYTCSIVDLSAELSHDTYGSQAYDVADGSSD